MYWLAWVGKITLIFFFFFTILCNEAISYPLKVGSARHTSPYMTSPHTRIILSFNCPVHYNVHICVLHSAHWSTWSCLILHSIDHQLLSKAIVQRRWQIHYILQSQRCIVLHWIAAIHWRWQIQLVQMTPWQENSICPNHHFDQLPHQPLRPIWPIWPIQIRYM